MTRWAVAVNALMQSPALPISPPSLDAAIDLVTDGGIEVVVSRMIGGFETAGRERLVKMAKGEMRRVHAVGQDRGFPSKSFAPWLTIA